MNRYAYVNNDPVNFVDPSGLLLAPFITLYCRNGDCLSFLRWDSISGFGGSGLDPFDSPDPGGGGGQSSAQADKAAKERDASDCHRFANMVQDIANRATSRRDFLDQLARTFTAANNSSIGEMRRTANLALPAGRPSFGAGGFKEQFRDPSNQVRHFVGGYIAGADIGWVPALAVMNNREHPNTGGVNDADRALNAVSTLMGAGTIGNTIQSIRNGIGDELRKQVCQ